MDKTIKKVQQVISEFEKLGDKIALPRISIFLKIAAKEGITVRELEKMVSIRQPSIMKNLKILEEEELIKCIPEADPYFRFTYHVGKKGKLIIQTLDHIIG